MHHAGHALTKKEGSLLLSHWYKFKCLVTFRQVSRVAAEVENKWGTKKLLEKKLLFIENKIS